MRGLRHLLLFTPLLIAGCASQSSQPQRVIDAMPVTRPATDFTWSHDAIIRGSREEKSIALMFTGGSWNNGLEFILDTLDERGIKGAFYFTGEFLDNEENFAAFDRMIATGHYIGPHGHGHLLYAPWEDRSQTLVTQEEFAEDLRKNIAQVEALGVPRDEIVWWVPPYEWYNEQIVEWSLAEDIRLHNFSPGTLSAADYTIPSAGNYRDSQTIYDSIIAREESDPDGLNGFLLFTHVGAHPERTDVFHARLPGLLDELSERGYRFVSVAEMLYGAPLLP